MRLDALGLLLSGLAGQPVITHNDGTISADKKSAMSTVLYRTQKNLHVPQWSSKIASQVCWFNESGIFELDLEPDADPIFQVISNQAL